LKKINQISRQMRQQTISHVFSATNFIDIIIVIIMRQRGWL
jgi:hypothetical protein